MRKTIYASILIAACFFCSGNLFAQATNKIDSVGNVGIGTVNPVSSLHVYGNQDSPSTTSNNGIFYIHSSSGVQLAFGAQSNVPYSAWLQTKDYTNAGNYYPIVFNPLGGNIGIGTSYPNAKLEVNGNIFTSSQSNYLQFGTSSSSAPYISGDVYGNLHLGTQNTSKLAVLANGDVGIGTTTPSYKLDVKGDINAGISATGGIYRIEGKGGFSYPWQIKTTAVQGLQFASDNGMSTVTFLDNGNVGLGTSTPEFKLDVKGDFSTGTTGSGGVIKIEGKGGFSYPWQIKTTSLGGLQFASENGIAGVSFFDNGNVSIGSSSSLEKLSVNGNISTKKVIVTQLGWSDYVFDKKYKLRSLTSLEKYINQHKHLPEIPTANEVEERGISVGDNQALLLKKIEELTLYVIDLKKENEKQQKEIEKLKKKISYK